MRIIIVRLTVICNGLKWIISTSSGLGLMQMVSEPVTERCASVDTEPSTGWIVRSLIGWRGERNIPYKGVETSP